MWFVYFCLEYMYIEMREERKKVERPKSFIDFCDFTINGYFCFFLVPGGILEFGKLPKLGRGAGCCDVIQVPALQFYIPTFCYLIVDVYHAEAKLPHSFTSFYPQLP